MGRLVIALDPGTGVPKWRFDPKISTAQRPANRFNCRGVTYWVDDRAADGAACRSRIFMGTNDARLIALDARIGTPCADFGSNGEVKIDIGKDLVWPGEFQITSAPVATRGVVVVGSAISDNVRVEAPLGTVRAFDARSGAPRWQSSCRCSATISTASSRRCTERRSRSGRSIHRFTSSCPSAKT